MKYSFGRCVEPATATERPLLLGPIERRWTPASSAVSMGPAGIAAVVAARCWDCATHGTSAASAASPMRGRALTGANLRTGGERQQRYTRRATTVLGGIGS